MNVWRLCNEEYTDLSGIGSTLYGGRWNSPGHAVVYTTSSLALAFVEVIPSLRKNVIPKSYVSLYINIDDDVSKKEIQRDAFPLDWREEKTRRWFIETGDQWVKERKELLLIVPSVIIPEERNILINPHHPEMTKVEIQTINPFSVDQRFVS